jgi:threonine dehydratase
MMATVTIPAIDDVRAARETVRGLVHETPVLSSATLSEITGAPVWLKAELFQRVGAFKPRGAFNRVAALTEEERRRGVIAISAGNHAQALALAAREYDVDALIVMWRDASEAKIAATLGYGASVDTESAGSLEALARMKELQAETGRVLVHPYDDPLVIAGQGTVGLELVEQVPELDTVLVPIGGGGLISGITIAVKALRPGTRVIGIEPVGSDAVRLGLEAGHPVPLSPAVTVADALRSPVAGDIALEVLGRQLDDLVLVTEDEIHEGMRFLYSRAKLACEGGGAVGVAALLAGKVDVRGRSGVACVISGGNVSPEIAADVLASR